MSHRSSTSISITNVDTYEFRPSCKHFPILSKWLIFTWVISEYLNFTMFWLLSCKSIFFTYHIIDLLYPVSICWSQTNKNVTIIASEKNVLIKSITSRSSCVKRWVKLCHFWCNICQGHKHKIDISFDLMNASQCRKIHKNEQKRCISY